MAALAALVSFFPRTGPTIEVEMIEFRFEPVRLVVHVGDSVSMVNRGRATHTFTCPGCRVDSGNVQPGQSKTVRFAKAGTYPYVCRYHEGEGMTGDVVVLRAGQPTPSPSPQPPALEPPPGS